MTVAQWTDDVAAPIGLGVWAAETKAAAQIARALATTPFVPDTLRVMARGEVDVEATTATVTAALLTGREVGLSPMASLRSIVVVHGTPTMVALALRGLVLSRGHDLWLVESSTTRAIMAGQRKGSGHTQQVTWTIDDARRLGIAGRDPWRKQPQNMLVARATASLARLIAPEALLGLPYITEELDDVDGAPQPAELAGEEPTDVRPPRKRTARRTLRPVTTAQLPPSPDTPAPPEDPPADTSAPNVPAGITDAQLKALHTALTVTGIVDRDERLAFASSCIGRDIASSKELTSAEASTVLDALRTLAEGRGEDMDEPWEGQREPPDDDDGAPPG